MDNKKEIKIVVDCLVNEKSNCKVLEGEISYGFGSHFLYLPKQILLDLWKTNTVLLFGGRKEIRFSFLLGQLDFFCH